MPPHRSQGSEGPLDWVVDVPLCCLSCGKDAVEKLGNLKSKGSFKCSTCGAVHDLEVEPWSSYIKQADSAFDVLSRAFDQLRTNRKQAS